MKSYYSPQEIRFQPDDMVWLIQHLPELLSGQWPKDPNESKEQLNFRRKAPNKNAYFITPCDYGIEVQRRLLCCGIDGLMLLAFYCWDETEYSLAEYYRIPVESVKERLKVVLIYISRWNFRASIYKRYNAFGYYRWKQKAGQRVS